MTSFEIDCPESFYDCYRLDVFAQHATNYSEFHLMHEGQLLSIIQRQVNGSWLNTGGKSLSAEELTFIKEQIENNRG